MSRVGKKPIPIPDKTKITYADRVLTVEGGKGKVDMAVGIGRGLIEDGDDQGAGQALV